MRTMYNTSSSGYAGNDDCGEMSAWFIFSAMGFYPVNPTGGDFAIGSPLFDKVTLKLSPNKKFTIRAHRKKASQIYVKSMKLNGIALRTPFITYKDIMSGGELVFEMGD